MDTLDAEEREYAEKYVKMAKAGLPFPVVEHKMVAEGMPGYIQSAVKEAVEQQQQQAAATASPTPPPASASPMNTPQSLTYEDQATVQRFQKMLRLGMPPDAVQHKMMAEGTSQPVVNAALGNTDNNIAAETPQRTNVAAPGDESIDEEILEETVEEEVTANEEEEVITEEEEVTATDEHTDENNDPQQQEEVFDDEEYEQHEEETVEETANGSNIYDEQQETVEAYAFPDQEQSAPANYNNNDYYNRQQQHTNYSSNNDDVEYGQYNTPNNYNNDPPEYRGGLKRPVATTTQNNTATNSKQQQSPQQSKIKEARKRKCLRSVLILIVLAFVLTLCGLGVLLYFWLTDDDDGDDATALRTNSTSAPTTPDARAPTMAPTPGPLTVEEAQAFSGPQGSLSGTDVASGGSWVAIGQPEDGTVVLSQRPSNGAFVERATLSSPAGSTTEYGKSVDFTGVVDGNPYLIVGAPRVPLGSSTFRGGAAYFYAYDTSQQLWMMQGNAIQGGLTIDNLEEAFGTSVAASDNQRVVVGAPMYGEENFGRVYTFEWDGTFWNPMSTTPLLGTEDSLFGSAVDITADGSTIAAGQPADSTFLIYNWNAASRIWLRSYELVLASVVDLGTDVKFLSRNFLAVGAPSAADGAGVVLVFEREGGVWSLLGQITGQDGQGIGAKGTIDGTEGSDGPELVIGTATGIVERYDWFNQTSFKLRFSENVGAPVTSVDLTSSGNYGVVVGLASQDKSVLLEAQGAAARDSPLGSSPPTPSPTAAPTTTNNFRSAGGPFTVTGGGGFGAAVAWAGDFLAAGMPKLNGRDGAVQTFEFTAQAAELELVEFAGTEEYGAAIDMVVESGGQVAMLVGSPETDDTVYVTAFGSAYYYVYDGSNWNLLGGELRGDLNDFPQAGGQFGKAVAMASSVRRVAIAAPDASTFATNDVGIIYTFEFDGTDWVESAPNLLSNQVDEFMGTSLDMNADGSRLLVGSPGFDSGNGRFQVFSYNSGAWTRVFEQLGGTSSGMGSIATMINDEGTEFAVGGQGIVRVFEEVGTNAFAAKGGDLAGDVVCGAAGRVAVGTSGGLLTVYAFSNGAWTDISGTVDTGAAVVSCALSSDGSEIVAGLDSLEVVVYTF